MNPYKILLGPYNPGGGSVESFWNGTALSSSDFIIEGLTTIIWGAQGVMGTTTTPGSYTFSPGGVQSGTTNTYIVTAASYSERNEWIETENGTGFEAFVIGLLKGHNFQVEVIDDTSITPPATGTIVSMSTPYGTINALKREDSGDAARKREGHRTFNLQSYNAIPGLN